MISNRELASLVWLLVAGLWLSRMQSIRESVANLLVHLSSPALVASLLLFIYYQSIVVLGLWSLGLWSPHSLKATIVWSMMAGLTVFARAAADSHPSGFSWQFIRDNLGIGAILAFFAGLPDFSFGVEFLLVPFITFISCAAIIANAREEQRVAAAVYGSALSVTGLVLLLIGTRQVILSGSAEELARDLLLPVLLSLLIAPLAYGMALISAYDSAFIRMRLGPKRSWSLENYALWALFKRCGFSLVALHHMRSQMPSLMHAETREEVDRALNSEV